MGSRGGRGVMQATVGLVLAAVALAGCADAGGEDDLAQAAQNLDIAATSTTGVIRGVVVDEALRPVGGAAIDLTGGTEGSTTSNEDGAFGFEGLAPGTYFLTVSARRFNTVQQSAEVVAGVSDPEPLRVLMVALPILDPYIEAFTTELYFMGSVSNPVFLLRIGDLVGEEGTFNFEMAIAPNGTVAQAEFVWEPSTPFGENIWFGGGTYSGDDEVDEVDAAGPSVLVLRANATEGGETADRVAFHMWSENSAAQPVGAHLQQKVDVFVHVFHNFRPDEGWVFAEDGAHALPPP